MSDTRSVLVDVEKADGAIVFTFREPDVADDERIVELKDRLLSEIDRHHGNLIFDFSHVSFFGSAGIGALILAKKRVDFLANQESDGDSPPESTSSETFSSPLRIFHIVKDREAAFARIAGERNQIILCCVKPEIETALASCRLIG